MKRWILLFFILVAVFVYYHRDRVFVRNPLASVTRDGVREAGAQVFINYNNDVLLENDNAPMYFNLIEHEQPVGAPSTLKCIHYLACLSDSYTISPEMVVAGAKIVSMDPRRVEFRDSSARQVVVQLR